MGIAFSESIKRVYRGVSSYRKTSVQDIAAPPPSTMSLMSCLHINPASRCQVKTLAAAVATMYLAARS